MQQTLRLGLFALFAGVLLVLASCGGSEATPTSQRIARIEVTPSSLMLTASRPSQALRARAWAEDGTEIRDATFVFSSTQPQMVQVDAGGTVTALSEIGASLIEVSAGGVTAAPIPVVAARPKSGVSTLMDSEIVGTPTLMSATDAIVGSRLKVLLSGTPDLSPGSLLLAAEGAPVAGRVVEVLPVDAGNTPVVFEVVRLDELFDELDVDIQVSPDQARRLALASASLPERTALRDRRRAGDGTLVTFGDAACQVSSGAAVLNVDVYSEIDFRASARFRVGVVGGRAGPFLLAFTLGYEGRAGFLASLGQMNGRLECNFPGLRFPVPVPGFLQVIAQPFVPVGIQASGDIDLTGNAALGAECTLRGELTAGGGLDAQWAPFNLSGGSSTHDCSVTPDFDPGFLNPRLEGRIFVGVRGQVEVQSWVARLAGSPPAEVLEGKAGLSSRHAWSLPAGAALDTGFSNRFDTSFVSSVASGDALDQMLDWIASGLPVNVGLDLSWTNAITLGASPSAEEVGVDRTSFTAGELVTFDVALDPLSMDFPSGLGAYNVQEVRVYRVDQDTAQAELIASATAETGQTRFRLPWLADRSGSAVDRGVPVFHAFAVPRLWDLSRQQMPIELGPARSTAIDVRPSRAIVTPGQRVQFEAYVGDVRVTDAVNWTTTGGSIDDNGHFIAGQIEGDFEVAASSPNGANTSSRVQVQVPPAGLFVTGTVSADDGRPLEAARIDLAVNGERVTVYAESDGLYQLHLTPAQYNRLPDSFVIVASNTPLHHPATVSADRNAGSSIRQDFVLAAVASNPALLSIELVPDVHHLGNSNFSGSQNSQFQYPRAEGTSFTRTFAVSAEQLAFETAELTFVARGIQCPNIVTINGFEVARTPNSPVDGSASVYTFPLDPSRLVLGDGNRFVVQAATCSDVDDFEFSNAQIRFR